MVDLQFDLESVQVKRATAEKQSEANKALNSLISDSSDISDLSEYEEPENQPEAILSASRSTCSASGELVGRNCPLKQKNKDTTLPKKPKKDVAPKKVPKKSSAAKKPSQEAASYNDELVTSILSPVRNHIESVSDSASEDDDIHVTTPPLPSMPTSRPQVGQKTPKSSFPPRKCINVHCKEEKEKLNATISSLREQIIELTSTASNTKVVTPAGEIDAAEASKKGLSEIADGVWCCPVKVKALISSCTSKTGFACALFSIYYPKDTLRGRRLKDLDQRIVHAVADFAVIAKVKERQDQKPKEGKPPKPNRLVTKGDVMQALRQKCNQFIFQGKRPTYHQEKYQQTKRARKAEQEKRALVQAENC